jgi:hypothetical protein
MLRHATPPQASDRVARALREGARTETHDLASLRRTASGVAPRAATSAGVGFAALARPAASGRRSFRPYLRRGDARPWD